MDTKRADKLKKIITPAGKILSVLSLLFVAYSIYKLGFDFDSIENIPLFLLASAIGVLIKFVSVFFMGSSWADWLFTFSPSAPKDRKGAVSAYARANIGKYLPGNVMHYVERNIFASDLGISQKKIALASVAETIGLIVGPFLLTIMMSSQYLLIALDEVFGHSYAIFIILAVATVFCFVLIAVFFKKRLKLFLEECRLSQLVKCAVIAILKCAAALYLLGFIMVILYAYMGGKITFANFNLIISCFIIAWVLGFVTPGASGGIGVREIVSIVLLGPILGKELILTLSVIHRLITIIGDFLAYFAVIIPKKIGKEKGDNKK